MPLRVLDVSAYQGVVNWQALAQQGIAGGICKISEGTGFVDPTGPTNWAAVKGAGLWRAQYHFSRPDLGTSATDEAHFFLEHAPPLEPGDAVVLDVETPTSGTGNYDNWVLHWLTIVEHVLGLVPWVYTGAWYAQGLGRLRDSALARHPLWNAAYSAPPAPPAYAPWSHVTLWQWRSDAQYSGIGPCDESLFEGTVDGLKALGYPDPKRPVPAPPPPAFKHLRLTVATHLRPQPAVGAMPLGPLLPVGTQVVELAPPPGLARQTPGWTWVRTSGDVHGYVYRPDTVAYQP